MKSAAPNVIHSHWHHPVSDFQTPPQEFYATVEQALRQHQLPGISISRIEWEEGGVFSSRREYLRVRREKLVFDICAAPFGADYFFSWWLGDVPPKWGLLRLAGAIIGIMILFRIIFAILSAMIGGMTVEIVSFPLAVIVLPVVVWLIGFSIHNGSFGPEAEDLVLDTPFISWLYAKIFGPGTYHKIDTMLVFQGAVRAVVNDAVNELLGAKGMHPLTELEAKPVMRDFLRG